MIKYVIVVLLTNAVFYGIPYMYFYNLIDFKVLINTNAATDMFSLNEQDKLIL